MREGRKEAGPPAESALRAKLGWSAGKLGSLRKRGIAPTQSEQQKISGPLCPQSD
jgi:hypothetical protein